MSDRQSTAPPRMSRYRSVRRAAAVPETAILESSAGGIPPMPPVPLVPQQLDSQTGMAVPLSTSASYVSDAVPQRAKTMSRYHNRPNRTNTPPRVAGHHYQQQEHARGVNMAAQNGPSPPTSDLSRSKSLDSSQTKDSLTRMNIPPFPAPPIPAIAPQSSYLHQLASAATFGNPPAMIHYPPQIMYQQPVQIPMYYQQPPVQPAYPSYPSPSIPTSHPMNFDPEAQALDLLQRETARQERMRQQQEELHAARLRKQRELEEREEAKRRVEELKKAEEEYKRAEERRAKEEARHKLEQEERERRRQAWEEEEMKRTKAEEERQLKAREEADRKQKAREKLEKMNIGTQATAHDVPLQQKSPNDSVITSSQVKEKEKEREKRSLFKRWGGDNERAARPQTSGDTRRPKTSGGETIRNNNGRHAIVPQIDAPVSAVNHGDRQVRVRFQDDSVLLPVKPTTTPLQLIQSAAPFMSSPIDQRNTLLKESFSKLGMERSIRMYEHIRYILNSWDSDDQHELILQPYNSSKDTRLYATFAPTIKPSGGSWQMSLSQKPGKWDKRYITITAEGQITSAKSESGKDLTNVCSLSDFEIFSISKESERKKIRPPKKFCYAVKSMQKSTMFLGDVGFVHFFSTADENVATAFFDAVFRWRSWYLVNVMGEGKSSNLLGSVGLSSPLLSSGSANHQRHSSGTSQYVLGSFNTGLGFDPSSFTFSEDTRPKTGGGKHNRIPSDVPLGNAISAPLGADGLPSASEHAKALHARKLSIRKGSQNHPPVALHNPKIQNAIEQSQPSPGLQRSGSTRSNKGRPSLDFDASSNSGISGKPRKDVTTSLRSPQMPPPLVDLTPQYVPPPQHNRKGRGFKPTSPLPGGLVDAATGPEMPSGVIAIPEARDWRARTGSVTSPHSPNAGFTGGGTLLSRNDSIKSKKGVNSSASGSRRGIIGDLGGNEGFTGGGLLGRRMKKN